MFRCGGVQSQRCSLIGIEPYACIVAPTFDLDGRSIAMEADRDLIWSRAHDVDAMTRRRCG